MSNYIKLKDGTDIIRQLIYMGKKHTIFNSKATQYLFFDNQKYLFSQNLLTYKELAFIKKVKKHVIQRGTQLHGNDLAIDIKPSYYNFRDDIKNTKDIVEIDLNIAYWKTALNLGYIDEKIYNEGLGYQKKVRLVCLGSLAVHKMCYEYDGKKYIHNEEKTVHNPIHASYFYHISFDVGIVMDRLFEKNNAYFYWVDAFFLSKKDSVQLIEDIKRSSYGYKEMKIKELSINEFQGHDEIIVSNDEKRTFMRPRKLDRVNEPSKKSVWEW